MHLFEKASIVGIAFIVAACASNPRQPIENKDIPKGCFLQNEIKTGGYYMPKQIICPIANPRH